MTHAVLPPIIPSMKSLSRLLPLLSVVAFAATGALAAPAAYLELGPLLGHVSATDARVWAKASGPATLAIRIGQQEDLSDAVTVKGPSLEVGADFIGTALVPNLKPTQRYFYSALLDGEPAMLRPYPSFVTAPAEGAKGRVRFAFVSCVGYNGFDSAGTWADTVRGK